MLESSFGMTNYTSRQIPKRKGANKMESYRDKMNRKI